MQAALLDAKVDREREEIVSELRGHVWEAVFSPHGNHVVQQIICCMRAASCAFIVDEIAGRGTGAVCRVARHAFGCRVLQRLLEHWPECAERLVEDVVSEGVLLCRHSYGNYVVGHILEYSSEAHRHRLIKGMAHQALALASDARAGGPLAQALAHGSGGEGGDRTTLARALLSEKGVLVSLACARHGHMAVVNMLQFCEESERQEAVRQLHVDAKRLQSCRYGRAVLRCLEAAEMDVVPSQVVGGC